jgi:putative endonuclease
MFPGQRLIRAIRYRLGLPPALSGRPGPSGEAAATEWLSARGMEIVGRNYRCKAGEVDVIARERGILVFVEVKTRKGGRFGSGAEAVDARRRRRLARAAETFLMRYGTRPPRCRFDVMEVKVDTNGRPGFHLLRDAFRPGLG